MADARQATKARNGKPADVQRMKAKQESEVRNAPIPTARHQNADGGKSLPSAVPVPSAAPARMQSGSGMGDFLDMIMGSAFPGATQKSFGENAPSTMAEQDMMNMAQAQGASVPSYDEAGGASAGVGGASANNAASGSASGASGEIDPAIAAEVDQMEADGLSFGEIAAKLSGLVGATGVALYLANRIPGKKTATTPEASAVDEMIAATDADEQSIQDKVEGRDNTARPGPARPVAPDATDVDMMIDQTLADRAGDIKQDLDAATAVEGVGAPRSSQSRFNTDANTTRIIDEAAKLGPTEAIKHLQSNNVQVTDDVINQIIQRAARTGVTRAIR